MTFEQDLHEATRTYVRRQILERFAPGNPYNRMGPVQAALVKAVVFLMNRDGLTEAEAKAIVTERYKFLAGQGGG